MEVAGKEEDAAAFQSFAAEAMANSDRSHLGTRATVSKAAAAATMATTTAITIATIIIIIIIIKATTATTTTTAGPAGAVVKLINSGPS